ncbi:MAG TPA: transferrin-binding protein-like solute binding protein [Sphingomicrobium sp.]|nr:transferrin-binding protein-like solute binding protein [Sphingomicrobium sp.]
MLNDKATHPAALRRSAALAAAALALCACGGGGGGGLTPLVLTPPPVQQPPAAPPAAPGPAVISAPAAATANAPLAPVAATPGGPTFSSTPSETRFPMLQTTLVFDTATIRPDPAINSWGSAKLENGKLQFAIAGYAGEALATGGANLDWTRAGYWSGGCGAWDYGCDPGVAHGGAFVVGYETPAADMPTTGTATYSGAAEGRMYVPLSVVDALPCKCQEVPIQGDASFTADFGARTVSGELTNMYRVWWDESAWNSVLFSSTITGNGFSGTTRVTGAVDHGMAGNATGTIEGRFFGPSAQEAGAVWTLFDGTRSAIGTLTARRP